MLPLPSFAYEVPDTLETAVTLAAQDGSRIIAGGTDLLPSMKQRLFLPSLVVSLRRIDALQSIAHIDGELHIGANCTLREVARHRLIRKHFPALAHACRTIATPTIQAMGTLGGNVMLDTRCLYYNQPDGWRDALGGCLKADGPLCHVARTGTGCYATQSADTVPVLWLHEARVLLASAHGTREVAISELYDPVDGRQWLRVEKGEILTHVILPDPERPVAHHKVRLRGSIDYGALLVAAQRIGPAGRAVISAVGPAPIEVYAEKAEDLPEVAWQACQPLNTHSVNTTWRKHMIRVAVKRALLELPS